MSNTLDQLPIRLNLLDTVKRGSGPLALDAMAAFAPTWRRRIRRVGGFWLGTCAWYGERSEMEEMFLEGMMRELRESVGGLITWQGFAGAMTLHVHGSVYERNWLDVANRVKVIYTRIGDNQFTNGSAESGAWTAYNTPDTLEQSSVWVSDGNYSCHIVTTSVGGDDGATIQSGITIVAKTGYDCRLTVNVVSGTWIIEIYRTDTGATLADWTNASTGQQVARLNITNSNDYAGTIGVRLYCETAPGEIYADGGVFQESPRRAETSWVENASSQDEFGVMELAVLEPGKSDAAANALALSTLNEKSYPQTVPPDSLDNITIGSQQDYLEITWLGYAWTLRNQYTPVVGTDSASDHITAMLAAAEFDSSVLIDTNATSYQIDDRAPLRMWEVIRDITLAGDSSGNLWRCGFTGSRRFEYAPFDTTVNMRYQNGRVLTVAGGDLEPWYAQPGLMYLDDLPLGPGQVSGYTRHDPRVVSVDEVEFDVAEWLKSGNGLRFRRKAEK